VIIIVTLVKNILITGAPRIGKTTIVRLIVDKLANKCAGFYTEEIREDNMRAGFKLITIDNKSCILAHKDIQSLHRVGKYGVNLDSIEKIGVAAIKEGIKAKKIIIIDEIGKMELFSNAFKNIVFEALDSKSKVLATILFRPHPFCDKIKKRQDIKVIEVTYENRNYLSEVIIRNLQQ